VSEVLDELSFFNVVEFLMLVVLNPLIQIAWDSWEIVEAWSTDSVFILAGNDHWSILCLSSLRVKIHASSWLHSGGFWLTVMGGLSEVILWSSVAFNDLKLEVDIRAKWDWLTTNWSPGECSTISVV